MQAVEFVLWDEVLVLQVGKNPGPLVDLFLFEMHPFSHSDCIERSEDYALKIIFDKWYNHEIQTVIDIDLKNFFGTIEHQLLEDILKEKIKDPKFMRYISRMFKSGILTEGDLKISDEGVPQGSICSPVMSNIFAHYAIDTWVEEMVRPACKGTVGLFRYADDAVIPFI